MTQSERRVFLIRALLAESDEYEEMEIPESDDEQKTLLRSLFNVRPAEKVSGEFLKVQDEYLREENARRGIVGIAETERIDGDIYLFRGDITTLKVGAIVNAANSGMTGCYMPCHSCIDNCIHTFAGVQLRAVCADIMRAQGHEEPTGSAKITRAFNLPCDFVIHTVGPIVRGNLTKRECDLLESCYKSCLNIAEKNSIESIAFCCISTGVFGFPAERAAEIAVASVRDWKAKTKSAIKVVFDVFSAKDEDIYRRIFYEYASK